MTVMFCDVRSFSRISEKLSPQEIIRFLIEFLTPMTDILLARRATIDKYIGDAILAFWNAPLDDPQHPENAARGALGMVEKLEELNAFYRENPSPLWPGEVKIGIGLNTGRCCVGNMGSAQRLSYSLIGDTVNLASRIEGLTKQYGVTIAVGSATAAQIPDFALLEIDRVRVVGRDAPETLHALVGHPGDAGDPAFATLRDAHGAMIEAYRAQDWDSAEERLAEARNLAGRFISPKLHDVYAERISAYRAAPPGEGWDGVYQATEK
jgi:adenylate cyclase